MRMQLLYRGPEELNYDEAKQISRLHVCQGIIYTIATCVRMGIFNGWFLVYKNPRGKIIGWLVATKGDRAWNLMLYVKRSARREGIGSALIAAAKRKLTRKKVRVYPWDSASCGFFRNNGWPVRGYHRAGKFTIISKMKGLTR